MSAFLYVKAAGDHRQIGRAIGKATAPIVRKMVAENSAFYRRKIRKNLDELIALAKKNYVPFAKKKFPRFISELEGIAEGAGLTFDQILPFSVEEEVLDRFAVEKCSTAAVRTPKGLLLGHNEDFGLRYRNRLVMVEVRPKGKPAFLSLSYPGTLAGSSCGLNEEGIAIANDSINFLADHGIPKNFLFRGVLEARSMVEVIKTMRAGPRAIGLGITAVSARENAALAIETSPRQVAVLDIGSAGALTHTNHVLSPALDRTGEKPTRSSRVRLAGLDHFLTRSKKILTEADLVRCLSSKKNWLYRESTLASVIIDPNRLTMRVINRYAPKPKWTTYHLN